MFVSTFNYQAFAVNKLWNFLPADIRIAKSITALKYYFLKKAFCHFFIIVLFYLLSKIIGCDLPYVSSIYATCKVQKASPC